MGPRLTVDTVVLHDKQLLLIERGRPPHKGQWALPGGFVDAGERVEQAARRETLEETGLKVELLGLVGVYSDPARDPRGHTVSIAYLAALGKGVSPDDTTGGDDAARARWFPQDRIPTLAFDHHQIVQDALARAKQD